MSSTYSISLLIIKANYTQILYQFLPVLIYLALVALCFNTTNSVILSLFNASSIKDIAGSVLTDKTFFQTWDNYVLFPLLMLNLISFYFLTSVQYWRAYTFMSALVFELCKTMYNLKSIRKHINKHKSNISQRASKIAFRGSSGTAAKMALIETLLFPVNLITGDSKYKWFYLEKVVGKKKADESLNIFNKLFFNVFPCMLSRGMFFVYTSLSFAVRLENKLIRSGKKAVMAFYISGKGELVNYTDLIAILKVQGFTTSALFVVIFAFINGIVDSWEGDYFKVTVGLNSFFSLLPFLTLAHGLIFGGANFLVVIGIEVDTILDDLENHYSFNLSVDEKNKECD